MVFRGVEMGKDCSELKYAGPFGSVTLLVSGPGKRVVVAVVVVVVVVWSMCVSCGYVHVYVYYRCGERESEV